MADSKAIAARVHPDVHEWLKEEAENQGTTLGSYVEEVLRGYYQSHQVESTDPEEWSDETVEKIAVEEIREPDFLEDGIIEVEAGSKARADMIREELSEWIVDADDKRLSRVRLKAGAAGEFVER